MVVFSWWRCAGAEALGPWMDDASSPPRMTGSVPVSSSGWRAPGGVGVSRFARACVTDCRPVARGLTFGVHQREDVPDALLDDLVGELSVGGTVCIAPIITA